MFKFYDTVIDTLTGAAVTNAEVWVLEPGGATATIYTDENGLTVAPNPLITDSNGFIQAYVPDGVYNLDFRAAGETRSVPGVAMFDFSDMRTDLDSAIATLASHNHDSRYYTETEVDALLAGKLDDSQATAFGLSLLDDVNAAAGRATLELGSMALATASDYYTSLAVDAAFAAIAHTHDDRYFTEAETNALFAAIFASLAEVNAGTEAAKSVSPDTLAGSKFGKAVFSFAITDPAGSALTTGDGKFYWPVPEALNGMNLVNVEMGLTTTSSSGIPTFQIHNATDAVDMLTTKITVDAGDLHSKDAAAAMVIDATKDDVATGDLLRFDCDVAGTGAKGVTITLTFQLP